MTIVNEKVVNIVQLAKLCEKIKLDGKKIAHCHGVFDLIHPGHINHFEQAKTMADVLVVTVTAAQYVNKGPGRPYFNDEQRLKALSALSCVDYVCLSPAVTSLQVIEKIKPNYYVKGEEYKDYSQDVTKNIDSEAAKVAEFGGEIRFTGGEVFSSTKLLNNFFPVISADSRAFFSDFAKQFDFSTVLSWVERIKNLKVCIIGDIVVDEYVFCKIQGLTSKDMAYSARYEYEKRYLGGALAVAGHVANFAGQTTVCGVLGGEEALHTKILTDMSRIMRLELHLEKQYPSIIKRRYVSQIGIREDYHKMFSINYLEGEKVAASSAKLGYNQRLATIIADYDVIIAADFGHGTIDDDLLQTIQQKAKFLAVMCQTNSSNYGTNLITKYSRANAFVLDERELHLAMADKNNDLERLLKRLNEHFQSDYGWLTVGSRGSRSIEQSGHIKHHPAVTLKVKDTVGAGDAYFSLASLCAGVGAPIEIGSLLGNIAGAIAANIIGNERYVERSGLLKSAETLLKY